MHITSSVTQLCHRLLGIRRRRYCVVQQSLSASRGTHIPDARAVIPPDWRPLLAFSSPTIWLFLCTNSSLSMLSSIFWRVILATVLMESSITAYTVPDTIPRYYAPAANLSRLASLVPQSSLPVPTSQLKYVVLGVGTQNYTCTSDDVNQAPSTTGAMGKYVSNRIRSRS
jgi:hypothetical protein